MNGPEISPVKLRKIVIDEDENSTASNSESPLKLAPHLDHDYGSASGGRYNSALEFYGDGQNNESFPPIEIQVSGDEDHGLSPVKGEGRPQLPQQHNRPPLEHSAAVPKALGYTGVNRITGRTQVFLQNRPRTTYTIPQRIRPEQTTPVLSYANSASRIVRPHLVAPEVPIQRTTPNVLRQSTVRPRGGTAVRPQRPPKPLVIQAPLSPESGLMNVLDEEEAQNQKFFMQHSKLGSNLSQIKPIVGSVQTSVSISPQKSIDGDGIPKPRGRGRPSNAEKALQLHQQQLHRKNVSPDKNSLQTLAEMALVSPPKPPISRSPIKPLVETPSQETKPLDASLSEKQSQRLSRKLIVSPKKDESTKPYESDRDEGDEVEGVDYITRCICELKHNDDYMVQCDQCKAWVHIDCFGGESAVDVDNKFFCHKCDTKRTNPLNIDDAKRLQYHKLAKLEKKRKKSKESSIITPVSVKKPQKLLKRSSTKEKENTYSRSVKSDVSEGNMSEGDIGTYVQLKSIGDRRCRNTIVCKGITGLMTIENVKKGDPLIEFKGNFYFVDDDKISERLGDPSSFYHSVVYTGLGPKSKHLFVDSTMSGTAARMARRSCRPNAKLSHCVIENRLVLYLVAAEDIDETSEITLPFDHVERGNPPIRLDCACLTDLAYSAGGFTCLVQDYNDKVASGTVEKTIKASPTRRRTVSPEKPSSPKSPLRSPIKIQAKSPRHEPNSPRTSQVEIGTFEVPKESSPENGNNAGDTTLASTSNEKDEVKEDNSDKESTPRRSSRKRVSTNERLSPKLDTKKKRHENIFDEGEIITGLTRREQQKIERLEQMDQQQNGRRKKSLEHEVKSVRGTRRSIPSKDEAPPVKKPKAESPEEAAANVLLGLAATDSKIDVTVSAKRQAEFASYWKRCQSRLEAIGPFSSVNFSEIQKIAASKKSSTCLTNSESSKLLKTGLHKRKTNNFERSSQSPSTSKAPSFLDKSIESRNRSFTQDSDKQDMTVLSLSVNDQSKSKGMKKGFSLSENDMSCERTECCEASTKKALSEAAQQRVISFSDAFKTIRTTETPLTYSMVGRKVDECQINASRPKIILDLLMTPENVEETPQSAPPTFTPVSVSKSKLKSLKERVFGDSEKNPQSTSSTPLFKTPIKLEDLKPLKKLKTSPGLVKSESVVSKVDGKLKNEAVRRLNANSLLPSPSLKRLSDAEIAENLNRLRSLPVFERIGVQFFKKSATALSGDESDPVSLEGTETKSSTLAVLPSM